MEISVIMRFPLTQCASVFIDYKVSMNINICDFTLKISNDVLCRLWAHNYNRVESKDSLKISFYTVKKLRPRKWK